MKSLHLGKEGVGLFYQMLAQALFTGFFIGSLEISTQTLFLEYFNSEQLPLSFFLSGLSGSAFIAVYYFLKRKWKNHLPTMLSMLFISILILSLTVFYFETKDSHFVFALFVVMFPAIIWVLQGFRDSIALLFKSDNLRRIENYLLIIQVIGVFIIALAIPVIINQGFSVKYGLLIASSSIILASLIQLYHVLFRKKTPLPALDENENMVGNHILDEFFREKYILLIAGIFLMSLLTFLFITFSFLSLAEIKYPESSGLATFFGYYLLSFLVLSVLARIFIYPNLIRYHGLKDSLLLIPVLLIITTGFMVIIWVRSGLNPEEAGFGMILLITVIIMIIARSYREAYEPQLLKIFLQPLGPIERKKLSFFIQRYIREPVVIIAGLSFMGLMALGFNLLHLNYLLFILMGGWIYLAVQLYHNYHSKLQLSINEIRKPYSHPVKKKKSLMEKMAEENFSGSLKWFLEYAPQAWDGFISENIQSLLSSKDPEVVDLALDWIEKLNIVESKSALLHAEQQLDARKSHRIRVLIDRFAHLALSADSKYIEAKMSSIKWEDRLSTITSLIRNPELIKQGMLRPLLKDNDFQVRISCIRMIGLFKLLEYAPELLSLLENENYYPFASNSLKKMSTDILPVLDKALNKQNLSSKLQLRILRLIAESDSEDKVNYLVGRLNRKEDFMLRIVLENLAYNDFRPYEKTRLRLKELLYEYTGLAAWNLASLDNSILSKVNPELMRAMKQEYEKAIEMVFLVLSVLYGSKTIEEIKRNVTSGSWESIGYSIELLDLFVDDDVKEELFILFEAGRETNRIKKLQAVFPVTQLKGADLLHAIINRDYFYIHTFTRVLAIRELEGIKNYSVGEVLIAQLFNPDDIVAETSVQQVIKHDPDILADVIPRLPVERREQIINILERKTSKRFGDSLETFRYLKKCLYRPEDMNDFTLFSLALRFHNIDIKAHESIELVEQFGETGFILAGTSNFMVSSGNIELRSISANELAMVKVKADYPEKNLLVKSPKNQKLIVLPLKSLREMIFDDEESFSSLLPAMLSKPKSNASKD